jgi:F420-dependent oxidoreductase-like protein
MGQGRVGIAFHESGLLQTLDLITAAEAQGVPAVWLTTGPGRPDALSVYTAAALRTRAIRMGTSIIPTYPRHPLVLAQQAADVAQLAPGRLRLGVGPSHRPIIESVFGIPHERPLEHLREFVTVVKTALATGAVDFDGARYRVHGRLAYPADVPVLISALQARSYELAGELADGAIAWICPAPYLRDTAGPALARGAQAAGRPRPPLIGHVFIAVTEDAAAVEHAARERIAHYPRLPFYQRMFVAAGYPEAASGAWSAGMLRAVVLHGNEDTVAYAVQEFLRTSGADELIASVLPAGADPQTTIERTMQLVASL